MSAKDPAETTSENIPAKEFSLLAGDCIELMKKMEAESVDIVVTSPPYNIGIDYATHKDTLAQQDYLAWMTDVFTEIERVLKPGGHFFLNVGATNRDPWLAFDVAAQCRSVMTLQNHIIWAKSVAIGDTTYGHFKPINSKRYLNNTYEDIFHFTKAGETPLDRKAVGVPFMYKSNISRFKGNTEDKRCKGNIWYIPYKTIQSKSAKGDHPATYPVALVEHCIKVAGLTEGVLLDPFVGTGTSIVAAAQLGLFGIGLDIDESYLEYAKGRIEDVLDLSGTSDEGRQ